jgi:hypothetical protein
MLIQHCGCSPGVLSIREFQYGPREFQDVGMNSKQRSPTDHRDWFKAAECLCKCHSTGTLAETTE